MATTAQEQHSCTLACSVKEDVVWNALPFFFKQSKRIQRIHVAAERPFLEDEFYHDPGRVQRDGTLLPLSKGGDISC